VAGQGKHEPDRELDELVTWASDRNIPLIGFGLAPPQGDAAMFWSDMRRHGITPASELPDSEIRPLANLIMLFDVARAPDVELLKAARKAGSRVAFGSLNAPSIDEAQLKARLQAIKAAGLGWKDFWVPGKP
jgi:hypothetical protein